MGREKQSPKILTLIAPRTKIMATHLDQQQSEFAMQFEKWVENHLDSAKKNSNYSEILLKSQQYSLLSGGKRFRPFLSFLVFKLFSSEDFVIIKNLCLAIEMIHTYSLIHDDLPCMDNDDFRRGKPTNHKIFSEDIALLAGDGLLTDAFALISEDTMLNDSTKINLIKLISKKIGSQGMITGQTFDMKAQPNITFDELKKIHKLKTANLIQASAVGAAIICQRSQSELLDVLEFSYHLGMAFQIKDDFLDHSDQQQDFKSYLTLLGPQKTLAELDQHTQNAEKHLAHLAELNKLNTLSPSAMNSLLELIEFNNKRTS